MYQPGLACSASWAMTVLLLAPVAFACGQGARPRGAEPSAHDLVGSPGSSRVRIDELAVALEERSRRSGREAVDVWMGGDRDASRDAARLLVRLDDLAIVPLLESPEPAGATERVWRAEQLVGAELRLRQAIAVLLDGMLDDRSLVPHEREPGPIEEVVEERVCDVALALARLLVGAADADAAALDAHLLRRMELHERTREIERFRSSPPWRELLGEADTRDERPEAPPSPRRAS